MAAVKVPADVELEDKLAFGLTARQLVLLAGTGVCAYGAYLLLAPLLPAPLPLAAPLIVAVCGLLLALGRHQGQRGDQLALALLRYLRSPKQRLLAPDGLAEPLPGMRRDSASVGLELPVQRILRDGLVELAGGGGHCLLVEALGASFELRSPIEQQAFVDCFARFLNSRREPLQLVVRSEPASLDAHADALATATTLPAELAAAAAAHADYLRELARSVRLRRRRIILVLTSRESDPADARPQLQRQTAEAEQILAGAQVALRPLDGVEAAALLAGALDPPGPPAGCHLEGVIHAQAPTA